MMTLKFVIMQIQFAKHKVIKSMRTRTKAFAFIFSSPLELLFASTNVLHSWNVPKVKLPVRLSLPLFPLFSLFSLSSLSLPLCDVVCFLLCSLRMSVSLIFVSAVHLDRQLNFLSFSLRTFCFSVNIVIVTSVLLTCKQRFFFSISAKDSRVLFTAAVI